MQDAGRLCVNSKLCHLEVFVTLMPLCSNCYTVKQYVHCDDYNNEDDENKYYTY